MTIKGCYLVNIIFWGEGYTGILPFLYSLKMAQFSPEIRGSIEGQVFQKKAYQLLYNPRVLSKS